MLILSKEIAMEMKIAYLPLNERIVENSESVSSKKEYSSRRSDVEMLKAAMRHYLLREEWDSISERKGFSHHIDYLHLNTRGANLIAELIQRFLDNSLRLGDRI